MVAGATCVLRFGDVPLHVSASDVCEAHRAERALEMRFHNALGSLEGRACEASALVVEVSGRNFGKRLHTRRQVAERPSLFDCLQFGVSQFVGLRQAVNALEFALDPPALGVAIRNVECSATHEDAIAIRFLNFWHGVFLPIFSVKAAGPLLEPIVGEPPKPETIVGVAPLNSKLFTLTPADNVAGMPMQLEITLGVDPWPRK
jgi:hypothetical protein